MCLLDLVMSPYQHNFIINVTVYSHELKYLNITLCFICKHVV